MNPSRPFILRPVATTLLMVAILLSGLIAYRFLPISALPEVDYPTIQVVTLYPGASPEIMTSSITAPLENQLGQIPGLNEMSSSSSGGASVITLQFSLQSNLDVAEQEVQAAINAAQSLLPNDLPNQPVFSKVNPADAPILTLAVMSDGMPLPQIQDLVDTRLAQKISQISGVGLVSISGGQRPAVRVRANPTALAAAGLSLEDLRSTVTSNNLNGPKGSFDGPTRASTLDANDQLRSADAYRDLIIAYKNGSPLRIRDVASVEDDAENVRLAAWANNLPAVVLNIQRQPGQRDRGGRPDQGAAAAAAIDPAGQSRRAGADRPHHHHPRLGQGRAVRAGAGGGAGGDGHLPVPAQRLRHPDSQLRRAAVADRHLRRDVPVRLLDQQPDPDGADHRHRLRGRRRDRHGGEHRPLPGAGDSPLEAALKGSKQIGFTIISLTFSLIAVLIPLLFMGDVAGRLFREFAITLAVAILISGFVSLTLTPMLSAKLLRHRRGPAGPLRARRGRVIDGLIAQYAKALRVVLRHQPLTLLVAIATLALTALLYLAMPKGFFPVQDTGVIQGVAEAPQSISFQAMSERQRALAEVVLKDPAVASLSSYIGVDGSNPTLNTGRLLINLKPHSERDVTASEVIQRLQPELDHLPGIKLYMQPVQDLTIEDRVARTQYQFTLQDADPDVLAEWVPKLVARLQELPQLADVASDWQDKGLQAYLNIDRDTASRLGVKLSDIDSVLYNAFGQRLISTIFTQATQYRVVLEVAPQFQLGPQALEQLYVPSSDGTQVRLSSLAKVEERHTLLAINHIAQFPSATLSFNLAKGYSWARRSRRSVASRPAWSCR